MRSSLVIVRTVLLLVLAASAVAVDGPATAAPAPGTHTADPVSAVSAVSAVTARADGADPRRRCRLPSCYAAISVNPQNRAYGWAYNQPTRRKARALAQSTCKNHSPGARRSCVKLVWVRQGCAAAAYRERNGILREYVGAYAATKGAAIRKAKRAIRGPGAERTWTWVCTSR